MLDTNIHIVKTLPKGKKEKGPGKYKSRLEERNSKKEQKGSYRQKAIDSVVEVKRSI